MLGVTDAAANEWLSGDLRGALINWRYPPQEPAATASPTPAEL